MQICTLKVTQKGLLTEPHKAIVMWTKNGKKEVMRLADVPVIPMDAKRKERKRRYPDGTTAHLYVYEWKERVEGDPRNHYKGGEKPEIRP